MGYERKLMFNRRLTHSSEAARAVIFRLLSLHDAPGKPGAGRQADFASDRSALSHVPILALSRSGEIGFDR